jgi:hypothetical protein
MEERSLGTFSTPYSLLVGAAILCTVNALATFVKHHDSETPYIGGSYNPE